MAEPLIDSPAGVLAVLCGICGLFFLAEQRTGWKLFSYLPPLIFIYLTPVLLSNAGVIPTSNAVYDGIRELVLPVMLVLLLMKVDLSAAVRVLGNGVLVMLLGTAGVVLGAPVSYWLVRDWLATDSWKAFGILAGSWIGGTGNMAAVAEMIDAGGTEFGLAVLGDTTVYMFWLPIMLASRKFADRFARLTGVSAKRMARLDAAAASLESDERAPASYHYLYLLAVAFGTSWVASVMAAVLPEFRPFVDAGTWRILLVTTAGIAWSFTPVRKIPGSHALGMALVYLFVARMGAVAELTGVADQAVPFLIAATLWIFIHGACCLFGAWLLRVDVHTAAIASAANIGGAASAPIVAAHHRPSLVPASILLALIGYAVGNYAAFLAAWLCGLVAGV